MIKKLVYIFIPVLAVLLMSHNTFAFSITQNVDIIQTRNQPQVSFYDGSSWTPYSRAALNFTSSSGNYTELRLTKEDFTNISKFELGDYVVLNGFFAANQLLFQNEDLVSIGGIIGSNAGYVNCTTVDFHFGAVQEYVQNSQNSESWYRADFQLTCKIVSYAVNNNLTINFRLRPDILPSSERARLIISFNNAIYATPSSDINQEQEQATQDAADNSATAGGNSGSSSQTATSSLLSVITAGVGAITSASPTNCKINGNMGNLNVGNIDLCANPVPTFMALIGSIIAVLVVLPLVILLFNRFISIIRSFQR